MASYNTNLKTWGAAGNAPPDGYNYVKDEPPVDDFDNWFNNNVINDIEHLISLTNERVESDSGTSRPTSPEAAHLFADTGTGELEWYDSGSSSWRRALDATGDSMEGSLSITAGINGNGSPIAFGDGINLNSGDLKDGAGNVVYDQSANHIKQARLENNSITVNAGTGIASGGTASLGGSLTVSVDDSRYVLEGGDTMSGNLDMHGHLIKGLSTAQFRQSKWDSGDYIRWDPHGDPTNNTEALVAKWYDSSANSETPLIQINNSGEVDIPSGGLSVQGTSGTISIPNDGAHIEFSRSGTNYLKMTGDSTSKITISDESDNRLFTVNRGGGAEVNEGPLTVSGKLTVNSSADFGTNLLNVGGLTATDNFFQIDTDGSGSGEVRIQDASNSFSNIISFPEGGRIGVGVNINMGGNNVENLEQMRSTHNSNDRLNFDSSDFLLQMGDGNGNIETRMDVKRAGATQFRTRQVEFRGVDAEIHNARLIFFDGAGDDRGRWELNGNNNLQLEDAGRSRIGTIITGDWYWDCDVHIESGLNLEFTKIGSWMSWPDQGGGFKPRVNAHSDGEVYARDDNGNEVQLT